MKEGKKLIVNINISISINMIIIGRTFTTYLDAVNVIFIFFIGIAPTIM